MTDASNINPVKPLLIFGYGNPSRGDDAVGPLLLDYLAQHVDLGRIELLSDFQLQIEHVLDLQQRAGVIFVDASVACQTAFAFERLVPCHDNSYTSHAMSPAALLQVFATVTGQTPPASFLLSIQAHAFELGEGLQTTTANHLQQACQFATTLLRIPANQWPDSATGLE